LLLLFYLLLEPADQRLALRIRGQRT